MNYLQRKALYVKNSKDERLLFDREKLEQQIRQAAEETEIHEDWLAEDISFAIEKYVENRKEDGEEDLLLCEVNNFVVNLLNDHDFQNTANKFASMHEQNSWDVLTLNQSCQWSIDRIGKIIQGNPLFQSYDIENLSAAVEQHLKQLNFINASDSLITELGIHTLSDQFEKSAGYTEEKSLILCSKQKIKQFAGEKYSNLFDDSVLQARDISRIFPKLHVEFDIVTYFQSSLGDSGAELMELMMLPMLANFSSELANCYNHLINATHAQFEGMKVKFVLSVKGLEELVGTHLKAHGRHKSELMNEISGIIKHDFSSMLTEKVRILYS